MKIHRIFHSFGFRRATLLFLLLLSASGCRTPWPSRPPSIDSEVMAFGAKVGTLARTVQSAALLIQAELAKPQPNVHAMQEAQVQVWNAHLETLGRAPVELSDLHDSWIEASFHCQNITNLAVINLGGDLTPCLAEIEVIVKATEKYMPTPAGPTGVNP